MRRVILVDRVMLAQYTYGLKTKYKFMTTVRAADGLNYKIMSHRRLKLETGQLLTLHEIRLWRYGARKAEWDVAYRQVRTRVLASR